MKIPMLPLHIMTSKTIKEKEAAARANGVAEGKAFSNRQIAVLLNPRLRKPIRMISKRSESG
jgi:hypothetical protein